MRNIALVIAFLFYCSGCIHWHDPGETCSNTQLVLASFDTVPVLPLSLFDLRDSVRYKVSQYIEPASDCKNIRFNVYRSTGLSDTTKVSINYYYAGDSCFKLHTWNNVLMLLQNKRGEFMAGGEVISSDSLDDKVFSYYDHPETYGLDPDSNKRLNLVISWDEETTEAMFNNFASGIIQGYLNFLDKKASIEFKAGYCCLNRKDLMKLSQTFPLNIVIADHEVLELTEIDSIPDFEFELLDSL